MNEETVSYWLILPEYYTGRDFTIGKEIHILPLPGDYYFSGWRKIPKRKHKTFAFVFIHNLRSRIITEEEGKKYNNFYIIT